MSYKTSLVKMAIKWTPKKLILWVANIVLKDVAELNTLSFDLEARTAFVKITLLGETEAIEVSVEGYAIISEQASYQLIIDKAESNKLWLNNILARITGKTWNIPTIPPKFAPQMQLIADVFKVDNVA